MLSIQCAAPAGLFLAAFAAHTILSGAFPWFQGKYDMMIAKQLSTVSAEDKKKAADIAVPIAVKLLKERSVLRAPGVQLVHSP